MRQPILILSPLLGIPENARMPPTTSHISSMPPSESEATTEGDCRTWPLKSTGKRAKDKRRLDALLEGTRKRAHLTSDESSDDEDYFDRPLDKRY